MGNKITSRKENYSKWYNDIVSEAGLAESSDVRGCMVIKPYGFSIWELMKSQLDKMFKETGPKHNPVFKVEVQILNSSKFFGYGKSKKIAQKNAAHNLINSLNLNK